MSSLLIPEDYESKLDIKETNKAINLIDNFFEQGVLSELDLIKFIQPLFSVHEEVSDENNDNNLIFKIKGCNNEFKPLNNFDEWIRFALTKYGFIINEGILIDFKTIQPDSDSDNLNSAVINKLVFEKVIDKKERAKDNLKNIVDIIYNILYKCNQLILSKYNNLIYSMPEELTFISTMQLEEMYPDEIPEQREYLAAKEYGAVFLDEIGGMLRSGQPHEITEPDYSDWELNGKILLYYDLIDVVLNVASISVKVDSNSLNRQLIISGKQERSVLPYQKAVLSNELSQSIGGHINKDLIYMLFLEKAHIGEISLSWWNRDIAEICKENNIKFL